MLDEGEVGGAEYADVHFGAGMGGVGEGWLGVVVVVAAALRRVAGGVLSCYRAEGAIWLSRVWCWCWCRCREVG